MHQALLKCARPVAGLCRPASCGGRCSGRGCSRPQPRHCKRCAASVLACCPHRSSGDPAFREPGTLQLLPLSCHLGPLACGSCLHPVQVPNFTTWNRVCRCRQRQPRTASCRLPGTSARRRAVRSPRRQPWRQPPSAHRHLEAATVEWLQGRHPLPQGTPHSSIRASQCSCMCGQLGSIVQAQCKPRLCTPCVRQDAARWSIVCRVPEGALRGPPPLALASRRNRAVKP